MEDFDLENPLTNYEGLHAETIAALFATESDHMPQISYYQSFKTGSLDVSVRRQAISLIRKAKFSCNIDPFIAFLAVNYLDRFMSIQGMPQEKPWILKLLSVSCISLAAKMNKSFVSITNIQNEEGLIFDCETVRRMELLILGALQWRMRSITPFAFLSFFLSLLELHDLSLKQALKTRATEIILKAQNEISLLQCEPSIMAASALLSASHKLLPLQFPCFLNAISSCIYVNKEKLLDGMRLMRDVVIDGQESMFDILSCSDTPVSVLDRHFFTSSESEKTSSIRSESEIKRQKITDFCSESFHLSQIQHC